MQVRNISGVTNPFLVRANEQQRNKMAERQTLPKLQNDAFVKTEDGRYISKSVNSSGEVMINITKHNWSPEGVLDSTETLSVPAKNKSIGYKTVADYEHNEVSGSIVKDPLSYDSVHKTLVTERKDPITGKTVAKQTYEMSDVPGIYNVKETDALGRTKVLSSAKKTPDGGIYISKNMTSLDGTTTTYRYSKDAKENHVRMFNQITDKNGKVLSTVDRTYDRVNENLAYSSVNGRKYTIEQKGEDTIVTDEFAGTKTVLNEEMFTVPLKQKVMYDALDKVEGGSAQKADKPMVKELLHKLPGDVLVDLSKNVNYIVSLKDDLDSSFMGVFGVLNVHSDEFVISHELGHSKDANILDRASLDKMGENAQNAKKEVGDIILNGGLFEVETAAVTKTEKANVSKAEEPAAEEVQFITLEDLENVVVVNQMNKDLESLDEKYFENPIADKPQFMKEYFNEKAMFLKAFPSFKEEYIDYFIFETDGQSDRGRKETVAETNAMNSQKPMPLEILAMRTQILQQYFPRTIAEATKLTTPIAVGDAPVSAPKQIIVPEIIVPQRDIVLV